MLYSYSGSTQTDGLPSPNIIVAFKYEPGSDPIITKLSEVEADGSGNFVLQWGSDVGTEDWAGYVVIVAFDNGPFIESRRDPRVLAWQYGQLPVGDISIPLPSLSIDAPLVAYDFNGDYEERYSSPAMDGANTGLSLTDGIYGEALQLSDVTGEYVSLPHSVVTDTLPFSLSMWLYSDDYTGQVGVFYQSADYDDVGGNYYGVSLGFREAGNGAHISFAVGAGGTASPSMRRTYYSDDGSLVNGSWQHVAVVISAHDDVTIYIDGNISGGYVSGTSAGYNSGVGIGGSFGARSNKNGESGKLDVFEIFDRALTQNEVDVLRTTPNYTFTLLDPININSGGSVIGGLTALSSLNQHDTFYANKTLKGDNYWEVNVDVITGDTISDFVGVAEVSQGQGGYVGIYGESIGYRLGQGRYVRNTGNVGDGSSTGIVATSGQGDIVQIFYRAETAEVWFGVNGEWFDGNPETERDASYVVPQLSDPIPASSFFSAGNQYTHNFGANGFTHEQPFAETSVIRGGDEYTNLCTASSHYSANYEPFEAFKAVKSSNYLDRWVSGDVFTAGSDTPNTETWWQVELLDSTTVSHIRLNCTLTMPNNVTVLVSNTGEFTGEEVDCGNINFDQASSDFTPKLTQTYPVPTPTEGSFVRLRINTRHGHVENASNTWVSINQVFLYEAGSVPRIHSQIVKNALVDTNSLTNGLTVSGTVASQEAFYGDIRLKGLHYWEVTINDASATPQSSAPGIASYDGANNDWIGQQVDSFGYAGDGKCWSNGVEQSTLGTGWTTGSVVRFWYNENTRKVWVGVDATTYGDPVAETGEAFTLPVSAQGVAVPAFSWVGPDGSATFNFGQSPFQYPPVGGYVDGIYRYRDYAVLDQSQTPANATITNDLTLTSNAQSWNTAVSDVTNTSGKWYVEMTVDSHGDIDTGNFFLGIVWEGVQGTSLHGGSHLRAYSYYGQDGDSWTNSSSTGTEGFTYGEGDVVGMAADLDNGKVWFTRNGTLIQGDPVTGVNPSQILVAGTFVILCSVYENGSQVTLNAGRTPFAHEPPEGFNAGWY